jgi:hypothetical protein
MSAMGNIGNYFERQSFSHFVTDGQTIAPSVLSRLIRSGTSPETLLQAINQVEEVTNEHLCNALDRKISMPIFQALLNKVKNVDESTLTCALYHSAITEFLEMFQSGKTAVSLESLLKKVQYKSDMAMILTHYPELKSKVEADPDLREKLVPPVSVFVPAPVVAAFKSDEEEYISFLIEQEGKKESTKYRLRNKALEAIEKRDFFTARISADAIPNKAFRNGTMADIFTKCFEYGDKEAVECAFSITKMQKEERDGYLYEFIEECEKLKDKKMAGKMAIKAANEIGDLYKKPEYLEKIGRFYNSSKEDDYN